MAQMGLECPSLAERIGADRSTVWKVLNSGQAPSTNLLTRMIQELGFDIEAFFLREFLDEDAALRFALERIVDLLGQSNSATIKEALTRFDEAQVSATVKLLQAALAPFDACLEWDAQGSTAAFTARKSVMQWLQAWLEAVPYPSRQSTGLAALQILDSAFQSMRVQFKREEFELPNLQLYGPFEAYLNALRDSVALLIERSQDEVIVLQGVTVVLPSAWFNSPLGFRVHFHEYYVGNHSNEMDSYVDLVQRLCSDERIEFRRLVVHDSSKPWLEDLLETKTRADEQCKLCIVRAKEDVGPAGTIDRIRLKPLKKVDFRSALEWLTKKYPDAVEPYRRSGLSDSLSGESNLIVVEPDGYKREPDDEWVLCNLVEEYVRRLHTEPYPSTAKRLMLERDLHDNSGLKVEDYLSLYDKPMIDLLAIGVKTDGGRVDWQFVLSAGFDLDNGVGHIQTLSDPREIRRIGQFWHDLHDSSHSVPWTH